MKRSQLKDLGLTDEQIDTVMGIHGSDIEAHKTSLTTATEELARITGQLGEANTQIESFKAMDIDQIKASAADWKTKFESAQAESETKVKNLQFDYALVEALKAHKVKDPADVLPHLKRDTIVLGENGKFVGLDEQVSPLKESKSYLFESDKVIPTIVTGSGKHSVLTDTFTDAARKAAGVSE